MCKTSGPYKATQESNQQENHGLITHHIAKNDLQGMSEQVAGTTDQNRPQHRRKNVEKEKFGPPYFAHSQRKRRNHTQAVPEAKDQDNRNPIAVDSNLQPRDTGFPSGPSAQQKSAVTPAKVKQELITEKTAAEGAQNHSSQGQVAAMGGDSAKNQDSFALEEGTEQNAQVAVMFDQLLHAFTRRQG